MVLDRVDAEPDDLAVALLEVTLELGDRAEFGRADRGVVLGVREQDAPAVAEVVVQGDGARGAVRGEVGGGVAELDGHGWSLVLAFVRGALERPRGYRRWDSST